MSVKTATVGNTHTTKTGLQDRWRWWDDWQTRMGARKKWWAMVKSFSKRRKEVMNLLLIFFLRRWMNCKVFALEETQRRVATALRVVSTTGSIWKCCARLSGVGVGGGRSCCGWWSFNFWVDHRWRPWIPNPLAPPREIPLKQFFLDLAHHRSIQSTTNKKHPSLLCERSFSIATSTDLQFPTSSTFTKLRWSSKSPKSKSKNGLPIDYCRRPSFDWRQRFQQWTEWDDSSRVPDQHGDCQRRPFGFTITLDHLRRGGATP